MHTELKTIGSYTAVMNGLDAIILRRELGRTSYIRKLVCTDMGILEWNWMKKK
jgi:acetate kinase